MPIGKTLIKLNKIFILSAMVIGAISVHTFNLSHLVLAVGQEDRKTCPAGSLRANQVVNTYAECNIDPKNSNDDLMGTITTIINVVVGLVGVIAVIVIVIGGIFFATSQGDSAKVTKAKNAVLYGIVGLIVALLAFAIVNFVLSSVFAPKTNTSLQGSLPSQVLS